MSYSGSAKVQFAGLLKTVKNALDEASNMLPAKKVPCTSSTKAIDLSVVAT
jgi:hypothetical protein